MKKFLPIIVLLLGAAVLIGGYFFIKGRGGSDEEAEEQVAAVSFDKRPVTSLTPSADGHWLTLNIEKFSGLGESMDYELLYQLPDGRTQGVPGTLSLGSDSKIERKLLLGSESSGKFRYDEEVNIGTLTLRFRNSKGKLSAKFSTEFALLNNTSDLTSADGSFSFKLAKSSKEYFVVMNTFGVPAGYSSEPTSGPFGVFGSDSSKLSGTVSLSGGNLQAYIDGKWSTLDSNTAPDLGIFMTTP